MNTAESFYIIGTAIFVAGQRLLCFGVCIKLRLGDPTPTIVYSIFVVPIRNSHETIVGFGH
jgi:hypothetical protein